MPNGNLQIHMRTALNKPIARFSIPEGKTMEECVKEELKISYEREDVKNVDLSPTMPSVSVFEVDENGEPVGGSVALFNAVGEEVTMRRQKITVKPDKAGNDAMLLEGHYDDESGREPKRIGIFYDEEMARRIGSLWTAGAID